jgi:hypothetical protein
MNTTNEYPPRHIPSFRPLVPGEAWHSTDFTPDMLPQGWRPLLLGENTFEDSQIFPEAGADSWKFKWQQPKVVTHLAGPGSWRTRTRRPLPPPPPTFEYDGKTWNSHVPGDPCPVDTKVMVQCLLASGGESTCVAILWNWTDCGTASIIGYRIPDAEPQDETAKLRERIAELEQQLATALTPRPIAEAGPVKEGVVRLFVNVAHPQHVRSMHWVGDTHFIDICLPEPDPLAEYERAVAEAGGHYEAWLKAKGGVA